MMAAPMLGPARVTTEASPRAVARRNQPIAMASPGAVAAPIYSNAGPFDFIVRHLVLANIGGSGATVSLYLVPPGGAAVDANALCKGYALAANTSVRPLFLSGEATGALIPAGWSLQAAATGSVNVGGWGQEMFGDGA